MHDEQIARLEATKINIICIVNKTDIAIRVQRKSTQNDHRKQAVMLHYLVIPN